MSNTVQEAFSWTCANYSGKLCSANGIKAITIYWFSQGQKKEHLSRIWKIQFREPSADTEWIKYNTNGIKTGSSKKHWFAQSQEKVQLNPVQQQNEATLLLKSSKSLLQMRKTENYSKQTWKTKSDIKNFTLW